MVKIGSELTHELTEELTSGNLSFPDSLTVANVGSNGSDRMGSTVAAGSSQLKGDTQSDNLSHLPPIK